MKSLVALFVALSTVSLLAQQPAAPRPAPAKAPDVETPPSVPVQARPVVVDTFAGAQSVNIRLDVTVTDQTGTATAQPKTLMVILADKGPGSVRAAHEDRSISVDARPTIVDGRVRVAMTIESRMPPFGPNAGKDPSLNWQNSFTLLLDSNKPMVAMETTDAVTKRKMSIEVKATILK